MQSKWQSWAAYDGSWRQTNFPLGHLQLVPRNSRITTTTIVCLSYDQSCFWPHTDNFPLTFRNAQVFGLCSSSVHLAASCRKSALLWFQQVNLTGFTAWWASQISNSVCRWWKHATACFPVWRMRLRSEHPADFSGRRMGSLLHVPHVFILRKLQCLLHLINISMCITSHFVVVVGAPTGSWNTRRRRWWRAQSNRQIVQSQKAINARLESAPGLTTKVYKACAVAGGCGGANTTLLSTPQPIQLIFWFITTSTGSLLSSLLLFMDIHKLINNCFVVSTWSVSVSHLRWPLFAA